MMEGQCQCGAIKFTTPTPQPSMVYICHCNECRRQSGSAFGMSAVFPDFELPNSPELTSWTRITLTGAEKVCWFCRRCGARLFHTGAVGKRNTVIVKAGTFGDGVTKQMIQDAVHIWEKQASVPIAEGAERHDEEPPE